MNRLTDEKNIFATIGKAIKNAGLFKDIVLKLATYEDTGLEPEHIDDIVGQLLGYLDAEQAGLLIELPCKVGDTVYIIHQVVKCSPFIEPIKFKVSLYDLFNKLVFLTREEAEKALKEMEEEKGE